MDWMQVLTVINAGLLWFGFGLLVFGVSLICFAFLWHLHQSERERWLPHQDMYFLPKAPMSRRDNSTIIFDLLDYQDVRRLHD